MLNLEQKTFLGTDKTSKHINFVSINLADLVMRKV